MTDKLDFKKTDKAYYSGKVGRWDRITLPQMQFLCVEGIGEPAGSAYAAALSGLYPLAYGIKFDAKAQGQDFVVPPLEALWWADDPSAFGADRRDEWKWRAMIRMPDFVTAKAFAACAATARAKLDKKGEDAGVIDPVQLIPFEEGDCLQILHVGSYADEAPVLAHLHDVLMPEQGLSFNGPHHEIYLSDPRRVAPEKLRTILRQPVSSTTG